MNLEQPRFSQNEKPKSLKGFERKEDIEASTGRELDLLKLNVMKEQSEKSDMAEAQKLSKELKNDSSGVAEIDYKTPEAQNAESVANTAYEQALKRFGNSKKTLDAQMASFDAYMR